MNRNRVGINTTDPQFELDVHGDINLTGEVYSNGEDASGILKWKLDNENVYTNSNVGIGTPSLQAPLHIIGDTSIVSPPDNTPYVWTTRTSAANNNWRTIIWAYEVGLFVAVSNSGSSNRVMTSPDGINWTTRTTNNNSWVFVTWAEELGLLVAVPTLAHQSSHDFP
jgi:hypothetical protein